MHDKLRDDILFAVASGLLVLLTDDGSDDQETKKIAKQMLRDCIGKFVQCKTGKEQMEENLKKYGLI